MSSPENIKLKCSCCKKKLGLMPFVCSFCKNDFCVYHRMPEDHHCTNISYKHDEQEKNKSNLLKNAISDSHHHNKL